MPLQNFLQCMSRPGMLRICVGCHGVFQGIGDWDKGTFLGPLRDCISLTSSPSTSPTPSRAAISCHAICVKVKSWFAAPSWWLTSLGQLTRFHLPAGGVLYLSRCFFGGNRKT